ncbi:cytochrome b5 domain-containing protein [Anaerotignum sp. MB30-C6]|uniref:cytochrome b5 domain-containing protein n=1 Tax=Anaerotignum sp. MB30-C6 TaxID=3070814 RepID=UPI0027DB5801|nr:cytochrome b5 domain-containing protein [Anaerotignum sp. MB30-C6]WMI79976.1 cytochrome b5 domain-containing protein [Anaerotignum sp. MB30-C6]
MELHLFFDSILKSISQINIHIEKLSSNKRVDKQQVLVHLDREVKMLEKNITCFIELNQENSKEVPSHYPRVSVQHVQPDSNTTRYFTLEELAYYDGKDGRPTYVAVNGVVYDVTNIPSWAGGTHFRLNAGQDLTSKFATCHKGFESTLNKLPIVGYLS